MADFPARMADFTPPESEALKIKRYRSGSKHGVPAKWQEPSPPKEHLPGIFRGD